MADDEKTERSDAPENKTDTTPSTTPDLVTRVSEIKHPEETTTDASFDKEAHDKMIENLPPDVQAQVKAYESSVMSGANKKFMEAADIRKEMAQPWTPERVQKLLDDQNFVASAQQVAQKQALAQNPTGSGLQDEEWSALTEKERAQFYTFQQNQAQLQAQLNQILARQEDQNLMARYKNYEASKIDKLQRDLLSGNVHATREHLHKVIDYDDAIKRAYEYGKSDRQMDIKGKVEASSATSGVTTTQANQIPEKPKGMSNIEHFKNLALARIKQANQQAGRT